MPGPYPDRCSNPPARAALEEVLPKKPHGSVSSVQRGQLLVVTQGSSE